MEEKVSLSFRIDIDTNKTIDVYARQAKMSKTKFVEMILQMVIVELERNNVTH
jgi:F0F1-type ATP synthase membrane subunit c/vacuolar-type H+-ATPase subunit K